MSLTQAQITTLRKLTALKDDTERTVSIEGVLDSFGTIAPVDISGIDEISRSGEGVLRLRTDEVQPSPIGRDDILGASHQKIAWHQIALSSIMHGE